ncbi:MAG: hypothetical protein ABI934_09065 [Actinomycetota bacterium]
MPRTRLTSDWVVDTTERLAADIDHGFDYPNTALVTTPQGPNLVGVPEQQP